MAAMRQHSLLLLRHLQPAALRQQPHAWLQPRGMASAPATGGGGGEEGGGWVPGWLKSRLPAVLGGATGGGDDSLEELTLEKFSSGLRQARRLGGLTGWVHGTSAISDPTAQGTMRLYEQIVGAMHAQEREDLARFDSAARARVAGEVGCNLSQVDDCIARFLRIRSMTSMMVQLKREGKEMPRSVEEVERLVGPWRQQSGSGGGSGEAASAQQQLGPRGQPCPLAGAQVGRNTKCPLTRKAYKACCGRTAR